jgi:CDP-paratose 2-epimerase
MTMLEKRLGRPIPVAQAATRLGDQPVFYCNIDRAARELDWRPLVAPEEGVDRLLAWIQGNREEIARFLTQKGLLGSSGGHRVPPA